MKEFAVYYMKSLKSPMSFPGSKSVCVMTLSVLIYLCVFLSALQQVRAQDDFDVISGWLHYTDVQNSLYHHLADQAYDYLHQRDLSVETLQTKADWLQYRNRTLENLRDVVGPFPDKTPLNPKITGTLDRPDFTIEKIVFESQPGFYVTAVMLLPKDRPDELPAVIYTSGHTENGFRSDTYQTVMINLVKKGFIVFAFDPVGQGERLQYVKGETGRSEIGGATNEHSYAGAQCFLTGSSLAKYMIWDGIRAVDYLLTRDEVDPDRIGITGRSGGGTQSSYIAAFDDRISAAAPENYITSMEYLLKSRGPQDAEQNFYHGIARQIDHPDLLIARAPKPTLIIATTRDFFSIQGAKNTYAEVRECFSALGTPDNISLAVDDYGHGSTEANREAMYAFFQKYLENPGSADDLSIQLFSEEELQVTKTGQVATSLEGETIYSLNAKRANELQHALEEEREYPAEHLPNVRKSITSLAGYAPPEIDRDPVLTGRYQREGYTIENFFIQGEGDYPIPYLVFTPKNSNGSQLFYLHPGGKSAEAGEGEEIESYVKSGYTVIAPDLLGLGETGPGLPRGDSYIQHTSYNTFFGAVLIGRSIPGIRAGDINRLISSVHLANPAEQKKIILLAKDILTPAALHTAAMNEQISTIILQNPLISYQTLATSKYYNVKWVHSMVPGVLQEYDLPDIAALIAPRKLLYLNPVDSQMHEISEGKTREFLRIATRIYAENHTPEHLRVITESLADPAQTVIDWME